MPDDLPAVVRAAPLDRATAVRDFIDRRRPRVAVWTECDLRPALITQAHAAGIPLLMLDAGTGRPEPGRWRWRRGLTRALLGRFDRILAGDAEAAAVLKRLGAAAQKIEVAGVLQEGTAALPCNESDRDSLAGAIAGRPVWLAAGIVEDELEAVLAAHRRGLQRAHRLLLVLVPAEPGAGDSFAARLAAEDWVFSRRSAGDDPPRDCQIFLADTDGEMGLWYRVAPIGFLGNSLSPGGGRNPFEAAALGSAILHGPNVGRHRAAYDRLRRAGATRPVADAADLADAVEMLLSPDVAAAMAREAWRVTSSGADVTDRAIELIEEALDRIAAG